MTDFDEATSKLFSKIWWRKNKTRHEENRIIFNSGTKKYQTFQSLIMQHGNSVKIVPDH